MSYHSFYGAYVHDTVKTIGMGDVPGRQNALIQAGVNQGRGHKDWQPHGVVDRELLIEQYDSSSVALARKLLSFLTKRRLTKHAVAPAYTSNLEEIVVTETVLVTDSNSGFGYLIARTLVDNNYRVVGAMRDTKGRNASIASELQARGATIVDIDVTDNRSVSNGVAKALEDMGRIDVLINNAGVGALGWQESFDIEDFKKVFDINVFGVQRLTRAVLPHMKQRGSGTLIQISSILGAFVLPFLGSYNATKHAVEALAENYRVELAQFGIQSLIVQPGGFGTDFGANLLRSSDNAVSASYGEHADAPEHMWAGTEESQSSDHAPDPQMVADAILNLLITEAKDRPFRTTVDGTGLNPAIERINSATEMAMQETYSAYGMEHLFELRQSKKQPVKPDWPSNLLKRWFSMFRMMQPLALALFALFGLSGDVYAGDNAVRQGVLDFQASRFNAMVTADTERLRDCLADELSYTHTSGWTESKAEFLSTIKSSRLNYRSVAPRDLQVRLYGDVAIITGVAEMRVAVNEGDFNFTVRFTDVSRRLDDSWQLVAWQSAMLPADQE
ncbi:MAG: SDR family NAD(P)-dependent oxidoreductase [Pseudomonadota bacterium]